MMDNKQLAQELIPLCAGIPHPMRGIIQEAARRLLQMVPDHPAKAGAQEADSLRQLASEWPMTNKPGIISSDEWLRCVCTAAADRIEQMSEAIDYGRTINAENVSMKAELEKVKAERDVMLKYLRDHGACDTCKHEKKEAEEEPCCSCCNCVYGTTLLRQGEQNNWEWRGAKDTNVPSKAATDTDVGTK